MPVDYSKWDALELSDDSDIEVHPNVDKRSFIRAKQNQIHLERQQRRHNIEALKYERVVNDGLVRRIDSLLAALRAHADEARAASASDPNAAGAVAFRAVMESAASLKPEDDRPPQPPADVQLALDADGNTQQPETYTKMMTVLLDQVNKALAERKLEGAARYDGMVEEIGGHRQKVADLQRDLEKKLAELEHEEARKITSDNFHTGFDSSYVNKTHTPAEESSGGKVELLNPHYEEEEGTAKGKEVATLDDDDDEVVSTSEVARQFANIRTDSMLESQAFLRSHPQLVASDKDMEGILMMAFDAEIAGNSEAARQYVHQATLLEFCRALGRDGVAILFKRLTTPGGHQAQDVFRKDVLQKYNHIRTRTREMKAQKDASGPEAGQDGVEQIQLHAVEPGTVIAINVPPAGPEAEVGPDAFRARQIFEGFKPEMREALESGSLDRVNEVLGRMPVPEAEELVGEFSEAGILSMEDEILDATTEEGRQHLKDLGRNEEGENAAATTGRVVEVEEEEYPDPE